MNARVSDGHERPYRRGWRYENLSEDANIMAFDRRVSRTKKFRYAMLLVSAI